MVRFISAPRRYAAVNGSGEPGAISAPTAAALESERKSASVSGSAPTASIRRSRGICSAMRASARVPRATKARIRSALGPDGDLALRLGPLAPLSFLVPWGVRLRAVRLGGVDPGMVISHSLLVAVVSD